MPSLTHTEAEAQVICDRYDQEQDCIILSAGPLIRHVAAVLTGPTFDVASPTPSSPFGGLAACLESKYYSRLTLNKTVLVTSLLEQLYTTVNRADDVNTLRMFQRAIVCTKGTTPVAAVEDQVRQDCIMHMVRSILQHAFVDFVRHQTRTLSETIIAYLSDRVNSKTRGQLINSLLSERDSINGSMPPTCQIPNDGYMLIKLAEWTQGFPDGHPFRGDILARISNARHLWLPPFCHGLNAVDVLGDVVSCGNLPERWPIFHANMVRVVSGTNVPVVELRQAITVEHLRMFIATFGFAGIYEGAFAQLNEDAGEGIPKVRPAVKAAFLRWVDSLNAEVLNANEKCIVKFLADPSSVPAISDYKYARDAANAFSSRGDPIVDTYGKERKAEDDERDMLRRRVLALNAIYALGLPRDTCVFQSLTHRISEQAIADHTNFAPPGSWVFQRCGGGVHLDCNFNDAGMGGKPTSLGFTALGTRFAASMVFSSLALGMASVPGQFSDSRTDTSILIREARRNQMGRLYYCLSQLSTGISGVIEGAIDSVSGDRNITVSEGLSLFVAIMFQRIYEGERAGTLPRERWSSAGFCSALAANTKATEDLLKPRIKALTGALATALTPDINVELEKHVFDSSCLRISLSFADARSTLIQSMTPESQELFQKWLRVVNGLDSKSLQSVQTVDLPKLSGLRGGRTTLMDLMPQLLMSAAQLESFGETSDISRKVTHGVPPPMHSIIHLWETETRRGAEAGAVRGALERCLCYWNLMFSAFGEIQNGCEVNETSGFPGSPSDILLPDTIPISPALADSALTFNVLNALAQFSRQTHDVIRLFFQEGETPRLPATEIPEQGILHQASFWAPSFKISRVHELDELAACVGGQVDASFVMRLMGMRGTLLTPNLQRRTTVPTRIQNVTADQLTKLLEDKRLTLTTKERLFDDFHGFCTKHSIPITNLDNSVFPLLEHIIDPNHSDERDGLYRSMSNVLEFVLKNIDSRNESHLEVLRNSRLSFQAQLAQLFSKEGCNLNPHENASDFIRQAKAGPKGLQLLESDSIRFSNFHHIYMLLCPNFKPSTLRDPLLCKVLTQPMRLTEPLPTSDKLKYFDEHVYRQLETAEIEQLIVNMFVADKAIMASIESDEHDLEGLRSIQREIKQEFNELFERMKTYLHGDPIVTCETSILAMLEECLDPRSSFLTPIRLLKFIDYSQCPPIEHSKPLFTQLTGVCLNHVFLSIEWAAEALQMKLAARIKDLEPKADGASLLQSVGKSYSEYPSMYPLDTPSHANVRTFQDEPMEARPEPEEDYGQIDDGDESSGIDHLDDDF
eukprot:gnl/Dysnectes_brevis/1831_a2101_1385.p1 GENE.gnl/Dysnectes_brevis/1831_a2101_1385~~gnl/Dysnectes_brevis/1831_a2101_1385.p1  ORF type:complete len:1323 (+),score=436.51 gnl/Dysnectes_brevis/1831_a2101_1385:27-3971(+)